jgi:hypothetical protein
MQGVQVFKIQKEIIESLMGQEWLNRSVNRIKNHPAYIRLEVCNKLISQNDAIRWPDDLEVIKEIFLIQLDNLDLIKMSGTEIDKFDMKSLILGNFISYGDIKVQHRLRAILEEPIHFLSQITEINFASWAKSKGFEVTASEDEGAPDFLISNGEDVYQVECKRIIESLNHKRIKKNIRKANSQFKSVKSVVPNIVYIDLSDVIDSNNYLVHGDGGFDDPIQENIISEVKSTVTESLTHQNSSVSAVLVSWVDYRILGGPCKNYFAMYSMNRKSMLIHHNNPITSLYENSQLSEFGGNIRFSIHFPKIKYNRNMLCPLGKGIRYKHCCGKL